MTRSTRMFSAAAAALSLAASLGVYTAAQSKSWSLPNPDSSNLRDLAQITKANVAQLEQAWFYPFAGATFSPVYAHDVLYSFGRNGSSLIALDATTGKELWVHEGLNGMTSKGITQLLPGQFGYDTNPPDGYKYQGGSDNWGEMSIDEERGIVFIPTGSSTADF